MTTNTTRTALLRQLGQVFRTRGYEGATLTQLAAAAGMGKASLYHHFPGGKSEMAEVLLRDAVADLHRKAFASLDGGEAPARRLQRFLQGFANYLDDSGGQCLLAVLALGSAREQHGTLIQGQFQDWRAALGRAFEELGQKPKRAQRSAIEMLDQIYGAQITGRLVGDPKHARRTIKRLARRLPES